MSLFRGPKAGDGATKRDIERIRETINGHPRVESVAAMTVVYVGANELLVGAKVAFSPKEELSDVAESISDIAQAIRKAVPETHTTYIEPEVQHSAPEAHPPTDVIVIRGTD